MLSLPAHAYLLKTYVVVGKEGTGGMAHACHRKKALALLFLLVCVGNMLFLQYTPSPMCDMCMPPLPLNLLRGLGLEEETCLLPVWPSPAMCVFCAHPACTHSPSCAAVWRRRPCTVPSCLEE